MLSKATRHHADTATMPPHPDQESARSAPRSRASFEALLNAGVVVVIGAPALYEVFRLVS
jgi:hypothetical protein